MNRHDKRSLASMAPRAVANHQAELQQMRAMANQTILVLRATAESYFGATLPVALLEQVERGMVGLVTATHEMGKELTWGELKEMIDEQVRQYKEAEANRKAQTEAVLAAGVLPL